MMNNVVEDIFLSAGNQAVLLLHSFTSNAKEMRHIATALHEEGYTCYAPNLAGHGASPEHLFASSMDKIWAGARRAFDSLVEKGFEDITIVGQSLGGVLGIRLANEYMQCTALCIVSSPVLERPIDGLEKRVEQYSIRFLKGKSEEELQAFLQHHFPRPPEKLIELQQFIVGAGNEIHKIQQPLFVAKGALDEVVFQESIDLIADSVQSTYVEKKCYEQSGHLISLGKERDLLARDIISFIKNK